MTSTHRLSYNAEKSAHWHSDGQRILSEIDFMPKKFGENIEIAVASVVNCFISHFHVNYGSNRPSGLGMEVAMKNAIQMERA